MRSDEVRRALRAIFSYSTVYTSYLVLQRVKPSQALQHHCIAASILKYETSRYTVKPNVDLQQRRYGQQSN